MKAMITSEVQGLGANARVSAGILASTVRTGLDEARPVPTPNIRRQITENQICVLTFDRPDSSANLFDRATLLELNGHIDFIANNRQLKGVVFTSDKPSIFIAGADLRELAGESSRVSVEHLLDLIQLGQNVFNRIATLTISTVAAIHGACVGGGYELCLACAYRVASPDRATKIGLPETQLGILPAWGGCTRLPRLIGLPRALDVILAGKTLAAKQALKLGMVDEIAPRERLLESAYRRIVTALPSPAGLEHRRPRNVKVAVANNALVALALAAYLRPRLLKKTCGRYPAVFKALDVITKGISKSVEESLALERDAILELAQTDACHNLVSAFYLQERAKKLKVEQPFSRLANEPTHPSAPPRRGTDALCTTRNSPASEGAGGGLMALEHDIKTRNDIQTVREPSIQRCAVIGAGLMGAGIAQWLSARGMPVVLRDINREQVGKGMASIARLYQDGVRRHLFTALEARLGLDRIFPAASEVPLANVDLVIEAAVERMDLKQQIFRRLDVLAGENAILATNTSALSVSEIAAATKTPARVVGIHFFNPVHRMQLVEVIYGRQTDAEVLRRAVRFVQQMGKLPVVVKDSPGFVVNRILMPYLMEAGRLFEAGARAQDVDEAMLQFGMPMGPLRLIDEVGIDVAHHVGETLAAKFSERMPVPAVLDKMLKAGLLGRKSDQGFYFYHGKTSRAATELKVFQLDDWAKVLGVDELQRRMVLLMINEAARCLEEQIVAAPEDVDFAMIMGTGFAPFRGGPLRYADSVGVKKLIEEMNRLVNSGDAHFKPCALLESKAATGGKFYKDSGGTP